MKSLMGYVIVSRNNFKIAPKFIQYMNGVNVGPLYTMAMQLVLEILIFLHFLFELEIKGYKPLD